MNSNFWVCKVIGTNVLSSVKLGNVVRSRAIDCPLRIHIQLKCKQTRIVLSNLKLGYPVRSRGNSLPVLKWERALNRTTRNEFTCPSDVNSPLISNHPL